MPAGAGAERDSFPRSEGVWGRAPILMNKIGYLRRRTVELYENNEFEEAAEAGEALLREHWHNRNFFTLGYANDLYNVARVHDELENLERAAELYSDSAHQIVHIEGETAPFAERLSGLATVLSRLGANEPAYFMLGQAASIRRREFGNLSSKYADSLYNMATVAGEIGSKRDSLRYHLDALKIRKQLGNNADTIDSLHSVAFIYEAMSEYEKAASYAETARDLAAGDEVAYASACNYLAGLYESCKKYDQALPLYDEVLEVAIGEVGRKHSAYLNIAYRRANLLARMNRREEALESHEEIRVLFADLAGTKHIFYANCLRNMAFLNKDLGDANAAETLMLESLKIRRTTGDEVSDDIVFLINLYLRENKTDKALEALIYALMCTESKTGGFSDLIKSLTATFSQPSLHNPTDFIEAIKELDDKAKLRPIIAKWTDWEAE